MDELATIRKADFQDKANAKYVHILEKRKGCVEAQLQTFLCQREERRIVDEMDRALQQSRLGQVVSWEHDGLVVAPFHTPADFDLAAWQKKVLEVMQSASPNPLALKPQESFAEVLATYKALYPDLDWTWEDSDWLETEKVRRKLTGYLATGIDNADKLVVKLLSREILPWRSSSPPLRPNGRACLRQWRIAPRPCG